MRGNSWTAWKSSTAGWATLVDTTLLIGRYRLGEGGSRAEESALYRVRYFAALAGANVRTLFLTEADGDRYTVTNVSEATGRDGNTCAGGGWNWIAYEQTKINRE